MTYVYKCRDCGEQFEMQQRITDAPLTHHRAFCPKYCPGEVYRVPQPFGVSYRGQGFHTTDYSKEVRGERVS